MSQVTTRRFILVAACGVVGVAASVWVVASRSRTRAVAEMFGGEQGLETLVQPTRIAAYRLGALPEGVSWQEAALSDYPITSGPVDVPEAIAGPVQAALRSPGTYVWDSAKGCAPRYGVQLSFFRRSDRIDVLFCFECDILLVGRNGRITGGEDFDHARQAFVRAVKMIFPNDAVVQRLREDRRR